MLFMLVRHGIAEERGKVPDALRELTKEGKEKIEEAYPKLCAKLKNNSVRLVSSPLVRARQTAEVFGKLLDVEVELRDWVAEGEMNELFRCIDETRDDVLIVVGHEPTLSYWCERFGFKVGWMKKGSVAFFEVDRGIDFFAYFRIKDMIEEKGKKIIQSL